MGNIVISVDRRDYEVMAARAEKQGFGDLTLRQVLEILIDTTANDIRREDKL